MNSRERQRAAIVRFLHERRFMSFEQIADRLRLDPDQAEGVYDEAVASGVKPEKP
jgi:predicted ArsR family transcriptional regulator